jgi:hypothetical protein
MACERRRDALSELAAGAPASAVLEVHLARCEACREELATLRRALGAVDADLRQLLAAEDSPALAARIRQAAVETEARSGWRPAFALLALATVVAVAAASFILLRRGETASAPTAAFTPPPLVGASAPHAPVAARVRPAPGEASVGPAVAATVHEPAPAPRTVPREPEVLVPPGQLEALLRLSALVSRERVTPPGMEASGRAIADLAEPPAIEVRSVDIQPLEIVPLDPAEDSGT